MTLEFNCEFLVEDAVEKQDEKQAICRTTELIIPK